MLSSPRDIPCRTCGALAGASCIYVAYLPRLRENLPGYHDVRKYGDFPAAQTAMKALLGED